MNRLKIITSKEYWVEALDGKDYNLISNEDFAQDIASKMKEAINFNHSCKSDSEPLVCDCKDEHWVYDESGVDMYCKKCDINNVLYKKSF